MCYNYRMKNRVILKTKLLLISICAFLSLVCFVSFGASLGASAASSPIDASLFLPTSNVEYYQLSSPIDAYSDGDVTAIIESDQTLIVYYNGEFNTIGEGTFTDLQQVKKLNSKTLLVLDNAAIYTVDLETLVKAPLQYEGESGTEIISCNFFDFNGTHLVTTFNTRIIIYTISNSTITEKAIVEGSSKNPIAINDLGVIFYINSAGDLCYRSVYDDSTISSTTLLSSLKPTKMIADQNNIYYLLDQEIYSINVNGQNNQKLSVNFDEKFDLGRIETAAGISFINGNLLVADPINQSVSEFAVNNGSLTFTGFAIAKNKTAFNRVSNNVVDMDKDFNTLAILDQYKLTLTDLSGEFSTNETARFTEFTAQELGGELPSTFAFGNGYVLLSYNHFTSSSYLKLLNVSDRTISNDVKIFDGNVIRDITYSDGYFYVLADQGDNLSKVYRMPYDNLSFDKPLISAEFYAVKLNVDQSKNVYLYTTDGNFNKFVYSNDYALDEFVISPLLDVIEFEFDLADGLFALTNNTIYYLDKDNAWQEYTISSTSKNLTSFALDFDKKDVYISVDGEELLYKTSGLNNISIDTISVPSSLPFNGTNADPNGFKVYTATEKSFAYVVDLDSDTFLFENKVSDLTEYIFITDIEISDQFGKQITYYLLAGQNVCVLVRESDAIECQINYVASPESAFVTTKVNAYYLPIITPDDHFVCVDDQFVSLSKHQQIFPIKAFTFLDKDFYLANVTVGDKEYLAYVPVDFTVEILSKDFTWKEYQYEKVKATTVYADIDLTEKLDDLVDGTVIKLYQKDSDKALITYLSSTTNEWELGYISLTAIKNQPATAVRNVIVIVIVALSVCATTIFLVVRKRK